MGSYGCTKPRPWVRWTGGENVVVATASGKSMVFQAWTLHGITVSSEPTTLVFYPTKALANDQEKRWLEACELVGLPREKVQQPSGQRVATSGISGSGIALDRMASRQ